MFCICFIVLLGIWASSQICILLYVVCVLTCTMLLYTYLCLCVSATALRSQSRSTSLALDTRKQWDQVWEFVVRRYTKYQLESTKEGLPTLRPDALVFFFVLFWCVIRTCLFLPLSLFLFDSDSFFLLHVYVNPALLSPIHVAAHQSHVHSGLTAIPPDVNCFETKGETDRERERERGRERIKNLNLCFRSFHFL